MSREQFTRHRASLVSETQFACHQVKEGVKSLSRVTSPEQYLHGSDISSIRYVLHNGMYHYSTGIERLAKLTLATAEYRNTRKMPNVKKFGHDLEKLIQKVALLGERERAPETSLAGEYIHKDLPDYGAMLSLTSAYAQGGKRYEYLDSLTSGQAPSLYVDWMALVSSYTVPQEIATLLTLPGRISAALSAKDDNELGDLVWGYQEQLFEDRQFHGPSIQLALDCFRLARWLGAHLSWISEDIMYGLSATRTSELFPVLSEVVDPILLHPARVFFEAYILGYGSVFELERALHAMGLDDAVETVNIWQEVIFADPGGADPAHQKRDQG